MLRLEMRAIADNEADLERVYAFLIRTFDLDEPHPAARYKDERGFVLEAVLVEDPEPARVD